MASTPFNIFDNKGNVESMFNESLNQFKFDSARFQQAFNIFYTFNNVGRPLHWVQQSVEPMLKQMLKPFKRALRLKTLSFQVAV